MGVEADHEGWSSKRSKLYCVMGRMSLFPWRFHVSVRWDCGLDDEEALEELVKLDSCALVADTESVG